MTELIINLDELNLRELFEIRHQRTRDGVKRSVRLAVPTEIDMHSPIRKHKPAIACKAVKYEAESLVSFHIAGTLEELIEDSSNALFRGKNDARHRNLVRELTGNQTPVISEVNIDLYIHRRPRG
jgi:hypothetical protein